MGRICRGEKERLEGKEEEGEEWREEDRNKKEKEAEEDM